MAQTTYFGFESELSSKSLMEAINSNHGPGPLCGFGGFSINGTNITLYPELTSSSESNDFISAYGNLIKDRLKQFNISNKKSGIGITKFACISRDGYTFVSDDDNIIIPIEGSQGLYNEVIVIATHNYTNFAVESPVVFRAFWNQSTNRYYDLYKKSKDYNYPIAKASRSIDDVDTDDHSSFTSLTALYDSLPDAIGSIGSTLLDDSVLIGIYGTGSDAMQSGAPQNFAIIPYDGKFPMDKGLMDYNYTKDLIRYLYLKVFGDGDNDPTNDQVVTVGVPKGTIVMWYGDTSTIPYGWELCDGTASVHDPSMMKPNLMGKVPVGLSNSDKEYITPLATGGNNKIILNTNQIPKHYHLYTSDSGQGDGFSEIEAGFPTPISDKIVAGAAGASGNQGLSQVYKTTSTGGNQPVDIRQEYCVVAFIIKTLE